MRRETAAASHQYGARSPSEIRSTLLGLALDFVRDARGVTGVRRIALLGSILTPKARPKDIDVLVFIDPDADLTTLARHGRRLKGSAQARINSGGDVFLADSSDAYIGRVCHYRQCHPRALCHARHCGGRQCLQDDLDVVTLPRSLIVEPPVELHPSIIARIVAPADVERLLLAPLRLDGDGAPGAILAER